MYDKQAHLSLADRHLAEAAERMSRLRERIAKEWLEGRERELGERLLESFEDAMWLMTKHRQQLVEGSKCPMPFQRAECGLEKIIAKIGPAA